MSNIFIQATVCFFLNCTNLINLSALSNCSMRRHFIISPRASLMVNLRCPLGFGCDWNGNGSLGIGSLAHHYITAVGQAVRIYILSGVCSVFSLPATKGYLVWGSPCYRIWFGDSPTIGRSILGRTLLAREQRLWRDATKGRAKMNANPLVATLLTILFWLVILSIFYFP